MSAYWCDFCAVARDFTLHIVYVCIILHTYYSMHVSAEYHRLPMFGVMEPILWANLCVRKLLLLLQLLSLRYVSVRMCPSADAHNKAIAMRTKKNTRDMRLQLNSRTQWRKMRYFFRHVSCSRYFV